jgi:hypothetical protein
MSCEQLRLKRRIIEQIAAFLPSLQCVGPKACRSFPPGSRCHVPDPPAGVSLSRKDGADLADFVPDTGLVITHAYIIDRGRPRPRAGKEPTAAFLPDMTSQPAKPTGHGLLTLATVCAPTIKRTHASPVGLEGLRRKGRQDETDHRRDAQRCASIHAKTARNSPPVFISRCRPISAS